MNIIGYFILYFIIKMQAEVLAHSDTLEEGICDTIVKTWYYIRGAISKIFVLS